MVTKALGKSLFMELYVKRDLFSVKPLCRLFYPEEKRMKHFGKEQQRGKTKKGGKGERERESETQTRANARVAKSSCVLA